MDAYQGESRTFFDSTRYCPPHAHAHTHTPSLLAQTLISAPPLHSPIFHRHRSSSVASLLDDDNVAQYRRSTIEKRKGSFFVAKEDANPLWKKVHENEKMEKKKKKKEEEEEEEEEKKEKKEKTPTGSQQEKGVAAAANAPRTTPKGWVVHPHPEHGQYYQNTETGATQWHHPDKTPPQQKKKQKKKQKQKEDEAAPRGWTATYSADHETHYFVNDHTKESTWVKPTLPAAPKGWKVHPHADHGQYYREDASGKTQWNHPHDVRTI